MNGKAIDFRKRDRRWIKEGRGQGRRETYKRWLNIRDLSRIKVSGEDSHKGGTLVRPRGRVVERDYHFASHLEASVFDIFDNLDITPFGLEITDILEQYPLLPNDPNATYDEPASATLEIARELGLRHIPANSPDNPTVMTTDLIIVAQAPQQSLPIVLALAVKSNSALSGSHRERVFEKLEIEMRYWQRHTFDGISVRWFIAAEENVDRVLAKNLLDLSKFVDFNSDILPSVGDLSIIRQACLDASNSSLPVSRLGRRLDQQLRLPLGTAIQAIYHLIAKRAIQVDLRVPLLSENPLSLISKKELVMAGQS